MPAATNMTNLFIAPSVRCGPEGRLTMRRIWARGGCPDMKRFRPFGSKDRLGCIIERADWTAAQITEARGDRAPRGFPGTPCSRERKPATTCPRRTGRSGRTAMLADPVTAGQLQEECAIQAACRAVVDVLHGGKMTQLGGPGACLEPFLLRKVISCSSRMPSHSMCSRALLSGLAAKSRKLLAMPSRPSSRSRSIRGMLQQGCSPQW